MVSTEPAVGHPTDFSRTAASGLIAIDLFEQFFNDFCRTEENRDHASDFCVAHSSDWQARKFEIKSRTNNVVSPPALMLICICWPGLVIFSVIPENVQVENRIKKVIISHEKFMKIIFMRPERILKPLIVGAVTHILSPLS